MFATAILLTMLRTGQLTIGEQTIQVEIADTKEARDKGLSGRKDLPDNTGMLFVFDQSSYYAFWMKDTQIPLSVAFFDKNKQLIEILDMPVPKRKTNKLPLYINSQPALYALEIHQNWFQEKGIEKNMKFSFLDCPNQLD